MGVTTSLRKLDGLEIKEFNQFLSDNIPPRETFFSNLGTKIFDTKYPIQVPKKENSASPGLIGTLSEMFIDVVVGRYIDTKCGAVHEMSLLVLSEVAGQYTLLTKYKDSAERIINCLDTIKDYVTGQNISNESVIDAIYTVYKHGKIPFDTDFSFEEKNLDEIYSHIFNDKLNTETMDEIIDIGNLFLKEYVSAGILKKDSVVVVNPQFGDWSTALGAIGDIYIDGVIYDIKSRSKEGYHKVEIEQIYGYYLASLLDKYYSVSFQDKKLEKKSSNMENKEVSGIGIYMSRFGEIIVCDLCKTNSILSKEKIEPIANIIVNNRQDRLNNFLQETENSSKKINYKVQSKQSFKNIKIDEGLYKEKTLAEYSSYAYPTKVKSDYDISDKEPVMWSGDIPSIVKEKDLFYFVRAKASFEIKKGNQPFVHAKSSFFFKSTMMETSDVFDEKTNKYYRFYKDHKGNIVESMAELTMTKEDFELFKKTYSIRNLIILSGCYFI